jgi:hypothetical protein
VRLCVKYGTVGQATDDNVIWHMHIAFLMTKATDTHIQNVQYLLLFRSNSGYTKAPYCYVIRLLPVLFILREGR